MTTKNEEAKIHLRVLFKNGTEFTMKVEDYTVRHNNVTGDLVGFDFKSCTENVPVYIDLKQVNAIVRVFSNEME